METPVRFKPESCFLCGSASHELVSIFTEAPDGEKPFGQEGYYRELWRCSGCGVYSNKHDYDLSQSYYGSYGEIAYFDKQGVSRYEAIMNLPPEKSDNRMRVQRILAYLNANFPEMEKGLLDIGCGMAVFPAVMRENGWAVTAIDPSPVNVEHACRVAQVDAIEGTFPDVEIEDAFPFVTLNKVLEHIKNPTPFLTATRRQMLQDGVVYIELPDGEAAIEEGYTRSEFFLDHYHVFSIASLDVLARNAGFTPQQIIRFRDPSGKYTLAAFLTIHWDAEWEAG